MGRINFIEIIIAHFGTLRSLNQKSKGIYWGDCIVFILFPLLLSWYLTYLGVGLKEVAGDLIKSVAIFAAFLFNLLAIIFNTLKEYKIDPSISAIKKKYVNEIHANISFNILTSIGLIVFLLAYKVFDANTNNDLVIEAFLLWVVYFLSFLFVLTLLMNLKRIYILLKSDS